MTAAHKFAQEAWHTFEARDVDNLERFRKQVLHEAAEIAGKHSELAAAALRREAAKC